MPELETNLRRARGEPREEFTRRKFLLGNSRALEKPSPALYSPELIDSYIVPNGCSLKRKLSRRIKKIDGHLVATNDRRGVDCGGRGLL